MRHTGLIVLLFLLGLSASAAAQSAVGRQTADPTDAIPLQLPADAAPGGHTITAGAPPRTPVTLAPLSEFPSAVDGCVASSTAAVLNIPLGRVASAPTVVNTFSSEPTDPDIGVCMLGNPSNPRGYRTVWYYLVAPTTGKLYVEAAPNFDFADDYDTVIAVFEGNCGALTLRNCDDDANGFLSRVTYDVVQGNGYYILIADRNLGVNGAARVNIQAWIESVNYWEGNDNWNQPSAGRSRHAAVVVGNFIYVFGGQTVLNETAPIRTGSAARFDTTTGTWRALAPMPGDCDPNGYSNTQAAHVNGRIYLPAGYVGDNTLYSGVHCIYTIATDAWSVGTSAPWAAAPTAYAAVVARPNADGYYVIGGLNGPWLGSAAVTQARPEVYFYAAGAGFWLRNIPDLPGGRYAHAATLLENRFLCVVGGLRPNPNGTITDLLSNGDCLDLFNTAAGWQSIAPLNVPRFNAGSFVGPDGAWYVVGGVTAEPTAGGSKLVPVAAVERYDRVANRWDRLDRRFNLEEPTRVWGQGGFVGRTLWLIGGEYDTSDVGYIPVLAGIVERLSLPEPLTERRYLPVLPYSHPPRVNNEPDDTILTARPITLRTVYGSNFNSLTDRFDMHRLTLDAPRTLIIRLYNVPQGENYDLYLYNANKIQLAASQEVGNRDERIEIALPAGVYYLLVVAQINNPLITGTYFIYIDG